MKSLYSILIAALVAFLASCNDEADNHNNPPHVTQQSQEFEDEHNAANSLDIPGVYEGNFPCSDCEGIHVVLTLNKDKTYRMVTYYLGNETNNYEMPGLWIVEKSTLTLTDSLGKKEKYFAGENFIQQIDEEGNRMEGETPEEHKLIKKIPES